MKRLEDALQRAVLEVVDLAGVSGLVVFAIPNGGLRSKTEAAIFQGLGVKRGVPDLLFVIPPDGRFAGLELKAPRGKLSTAQEICAEEILGAGGMWACVRDVETAVAVLTEWGAIKRNRVRLQVVK